jgi:hypothetical protein
MAPSTCIEARRLVIVKLLREGLIGPDARPAELARRPVAAARAPRAHVPRAHVPPPAA